MSCYEQFGWNYFDVQALPGQEAEKLSIYFEELAAYHAKKNREMKRNSGGSGGDRSDEVTEWEEKDPDWDSGDYSAYLEPEPDDDWPGWS